MLRKAERARKVRVGDVYAPPGAAPRGVLEVIVDQAADVVTLVHPGAMAFTQCEGVNSLVPVLRASRVVEHQEARVVPVPARRGRQRGGPSAAVYSTRSA